MVTKVYLHKNFTFKKVALFCMGLYLFTLNFPHVMTIRETSFFLAIILAAISLSRNYEWDWSPLKTYFLIWLLIALVSLSVSSDAWHSLSEIKKEVVYSILSFWLFYIMTKNKEDFMNLTYFVLISATLLIMASLYHYYVLGHRFGDLINEGLLYGKPTYFSVFMFITAALCITIALLKNTSKILKCYVLLLLPFTILTIYFTRHRASYLAVFLAVNIGIFIFFTRFFKLKSLKKKVFLFLLLTLIMSPSVILLSDKDLKWSEGLNIITDLSNSESIRRRTYMFFIEQIKENPVLGLGFGNKGFNIPSLEERRYYPHNIFISYGVMMGTPGMIILITLFGKLLRLLQTNLKNFYSTNQFSYVASLSGILILGGFVVQNLTDDAMLRHTGLFFWSIMGMILGGSRLSSKTIKPYALEVKMKASIIITAWNESRRQLINCLDGINLSADHMCETVVLVNKYEKDPKRTEDILNLVSTHPKITRYVNFSQNIGVARAWNVGVNICEGDVYIILNGDCVLDSDAIEKLIEPFSNEFIGIVGVGGMRDGKKVETKGLCENIHGFCFAVRKKTYREIGGFDNEFSPLADEVEYCARAWEKGWGVYIAEGVNYTHRYTISAKPEEDIIYLDREIKRAALDKKNKEYKKSLMWLKRVPNKK